MSRKTKHDMTSTSTSSALTTDQSEFDSPDEGKVIIDYRGTIGAAPGQAQVRHERSPWILMWPEPGVEELVLYPGVNVISAATWAAYKANLDVIKRACASGRLRELDGLDGTDEFSLLNEDNGMIVRTVSHEGLAWISEQARGRKLILEAVERRRPYAHPLAFAPRPYAGFASFDKTRSEQLGVRQMDPRQAMG